MSKIVSQEACPQCQEQGKDTNQDNLTVYQDGGKYCHACHFTEGSGVSKTTFIGSVIKDGYFDDIPERKISRATCEFVNYQVANWTGHLNGKRECLNDKIEIANITNEFGNVVAQNIRLAKEKDFGIKGDSDSMDLWGKHDYAPNPNYFAIITEGEHDRMAIIESCGKIYPTYSILKGAGNAAKCIGNNLALLNEYKHVVLAFDNDESGRKATEECVKLFEPGKVAIARMSLKDASDYRKAGRDKELKDLLWNADKIKPKYLVKPSQLLDLVSKRSERGLYYPWPSLSDVTYGFRTKEIHVWVGAEGIGKTSIMNELITHFSSVNLKIGLFSFEQEPERTLQKIVGSIIGVPLHLPEQEFNADEVRRETMKLENKLFLCAQAGSISEIELLNSIRYWARIEGVKLIIIDNIKGLCKDVTNENNYLKSLMIKFQGLVRELDISLILLSHVAKDKVHYNAHMSSSKKNIEKYMKMTAEETQRGKYKPGMEWETGRMPTRSNIEGTGTIAALADSVFALARNSMSEDLIEKNTVYVKVLKNRIDGGKDGKIFKLNYQKNGRLTEIDNTESLI